MMVTRFKKTFDQLMTPPARLCLALGLTPNQVTILGLALGMATCIFLILTENILVFCILIFIFALFDGVDGAMARLSGKTSRFGAYLDAMCDRYYEAMVVFSVAYVTDYWFLSFLVMMGIFNVSYAKARASMEVPIRNDEWPDLMERTERDVIYIAGLFLSEIFPVLIWDQDLFWWTLLFLVVACHFTILQRILRARRIIASRQQE